MKKKDFKNFTDEDFIKYQDEILSEKENLNAIILRMNHKYFKDILTKKTKLLENIPFGIKDNFAVKNFETTAASKIIRNFKPNYSSTVFKKLLEAGAVPLFKTNLDELAMGGTGLTSNYSEVYNPFNKDKMVGGSSSGSAYLVAKDIVPFAIGSDTGDSVRKPAAYSGTIGFKPTWGIVSRYGLYDFAPTWDTVGWFTNTVDLAAILLDVLQGYDLMDGSSVKPRDKDYFKDINTNDKFKIGVIKPLLTDVLEEEILKEHERVISKLKNEGHEIIELNDVNLSLFKSILVVYRVISSVEALSCNANLTGFLFGGQNFSNIEGSFENKIVEERTNGFGYESKKRQLFAAESILDSETNYHKARKYRTLIVQELDRIFGKVDAIIMPSHSTFPPKIKHKDDYIKYGSFMDDYLTLFNANGSPSITVSTLKNKDKSIGLNISTRPFADKQCLQIAKIVEKFVVDKN